MNGNVLTGLFCLALESPITVWSTQCYVNQIETMEWWACRSLEASLEMYILSNSRHKDHGRISTKQTDTNHEEHTILKYKAAKYGLRVGCANRFDFWQLVHQRCRMSRGYGDASIQSILARLILWLDVRSRCVLVHVQFGITYVARNKRRKDQQEVYDLNRD